MHFAHVLLNHVDQLEILPPDTLLLGIDHLDVLNRHSGQFLLIQLLHHETIFLETQHDVFADLPRRSRFHHAEKTLLI